MESSYSGNPYPLLSFGIPLRNAEKFLPRLLNSLLAQDFSDFEVVISDNASTDRTAEICQAYAQQDARIRYHRNLENIGQNSNFNRVLELASGKYFRWIGWDDWLEKDYARQCVELLESRPEAIGVTTYQDFIDENGDRNYREYTGERLDSPYLHVRYQRMLWFMTSDFRLIDPIYTLMRRDVLLKTGRINQPVLSADQVLAVELSLWGAIAHIPVCLAHRGKTPFEQTTPEQLLKEYYNEQYDQIQTQTYWDVAVAFWAPTNKFPLSRWEKFLCALPVARFLLLASIHTANDKLWSLLKLILKPIFKPVKHLLLSITVPRASA